MDRKAHWENIYRTKSPNEVSWTQAVPRLSLDWIAAAHLSADAKIIDIGGGDANLVDHLLQMGFNDLSVLDLSKAAIERAQHRLEGDAEKVNWIESDILDFRPQTRYDLWHDRAAFHFLTEPSAIHRYVKTVKEFVNSDVIIGTSSTDGPQKCSGIEIKQYDTQSLADLFAPEFTLVKSVLHDHVTPFNTVQSFVFVHLKRR